MLPWKTEDIAASIHSAAEDVAGQQHRRAADADDQGPCQGRRWPLPSVDILHHGVAEDVADHHSRPHARMATYGELRQDMYYKSIRDFLYLGKNEWGGKEKLTVRCLTKGTGARMGA
jgi:hypothetical protein